jgi:hypothetical protein
MAPQIVVERFVAAIEIFDPAAFFEAANNDGHSVPQRSNQDLRRGIRFCRRRELGEICQLALCPFDFDTGWDEVRSHSFQPRKNQYPPFAAAALTDDLVSETALRDRPSKQSHSIGQKIRVAG